jgi:hypothetical protein
MAKPKHDLWSVVSDVTQLADGQIVYIGGVAVFAHSLVNRLAPELTHDADAAISMVAGQTLRETGELVANKRLGKSQITLDGIEVDLYIERHNKLRIDYADLAQFAVTVDVEANGTTQHVPTATLGHLLLLKLDALEARGHSAAGAKDRRDVARILIMLGRTSDDEDRDLVVGHATKADAAAILAVLKSTAFMEIASRNAKRAAEWRAIAQRFAERLR